MKMYDSARSMMRKGATAADVREVVAASKSDVLDSPNPGNPWDQERAVELIDRAAGDALAGRPPSPRQHDP